MGMFDYIRSEIPLPNDPPPPDTIWFQTKDVPTINLFLEKWLIRADGRLVKLGVVYEDHSDKTAPEGSLESIVGIMSAVDDPSLDKVMDDFHGDIPFYYYDGTTGECWEYTARFTEGYCTKITLAYTPPTKEAT
jgi:hypothetical protein